MPCAPPVTTATLSLTFTAPPPGCGWTVTRFVLAPPRCAREDPGPQHGLRPRVDPGRARADGTARSYAASADQGVTQARARPIEEIIVRATSSSIAKGTPDAPPHLRRPPHRSHLTRDPRRRRAPDCRRRPARSSGRGPGTQADDRARPRVLRGRVELVGRHPRPAEARLSRRRDRQPAARAFR